MIKKFLIVCSLMLSAGWLKAQGNEGSILAGGLGGSVNYYYGPVSRNFDRFNNDYLNGQLNGFLGLSLSGAKKSGRTVLAIFGTYGLVNRKTLSQMLDDQDYLTTALSQSSQNSFYRLEGGLLLGELFRLSTGIGQQYFNDQTLLSGSGIDISKGNLEFYSSTAGFNFNLGTVALTLDVNFAYGKDLNKTVMTPSAGLMFRF